MRSLALVSVLVFVAACSVAPVAPVAPGAFDSVRDRLAAEPVPLVIAATPNAGVLDAAHDDAGGWQSGSAAISIASGAIELDGTSGALAIASLELAFDPIDIPAAVLGSPARLTDLALALPAPVTADATWADGDHAAAAAALALSLSWSLAVGSAAFPLGAQSLPAIPLELELTGDGSAITASLSLASTGDLWTWADLLKLTALDLTADATRDD